MTCSRCNSRLWSWIRRICLVKVILILRSVEIIHDHFTSVDNTEVIGLIHSTDLKIRITFTKQILLVQLHSLELQREEVIVVGDLLTMYFHYSLSFGQLSGEALALGR